MCTVELVMASMMLEIKVQAGASAGSAPTRRMRDTTAADQQKGQGNSPSIPHAPVPSRGRGTLVAAPRFRHERFRATGPAIHRGKPGRTSDQ